ncbi:CHAT domain-containing protein [Leptothoe sp. EHU-05/26/07-4]
MQNTKHYMQINFSESPKMNNIHIMPLKRIVSCVFVALAITVSPLEQLKGSKITSALAQSQSDVSPADLRNKLTQLDTERRSAIREEDFRDLYDIGLEYTALATWAGELGFTYEKSVALSGAENALSTILHNTGIFSFVRQNIPARTDTYSSISDSSFSFGVRWSSGQTRKSCSLSWEMGQESAALENSASKLLQRVLIEQGNEEAALLAAELGRTITVDKSVFLNAIGGGFSGIPGLAFGERDGGPDPCELSEDFAPRLTVADMKNMAAKQNATIVSYSIISHRDDPYYIQYVRDYNRGINNFLGLITWPSDLYIWVIKPNRTVSFVKQPLSVLDLESLEIECSSSDNCRPSEYSGLLGGVALARGFSGAETSGVEFQQSASVRSKQLNELYKLLIQPVESLLPTNPNSRVVFVPQGPLSFVPFAALKDSAEPSGQYLVEKHTIITAPNLRHLRLSQQKREELSDNREDALVVGNPTLDLTFAATEAEEVARILDEQGFNDKLFTGSDADKWSVIDRMEDARIIHLASHGTLDIDGPDLPDVNEILLDLSPSFDEIQADIFAQYGLRTQDDEITPLGILFDLYRSPVAGGGISFSSLDSSSDSASISRFSNLTPVDIIDLDLSGTELVVLSACNTGRGPLTPGGVVGLPFSFSIAGVPSIILSLWEVPDDSTSELMIAFYNHLFDNPTKNPQRDKAIALRLAMLDMLGENRDTSPGEWAAFTLVGSAD